MHKIVQDATWEKGRKKILRRQDYNPGGKEDSTFMDRKAKVTE